ncbi:olfactory receptor 142-like [Archocentrus centrarchus]|uniref:olfactory receptor 142-like n=1 Tax=Archocentrus centrarchus TaxID=63155 RepID=UPI0011E9D2BB|nr:olfactory receptor 142-like [Archocentrus centrarchus]
MITRWDAGALNSTHTSPLEGWNSQTQPKLQQGESTDTPSQTMTGTVFWGSLGIRRVRPSVNYSGSALIFSISYEGCLLQAFIMYSFACCDLSILAFMAFDRYLAICRPVHYHSFMTERRLSQLVCFSWLTPLCIFAINVVLTSRLKLCGSNIKKLFCVNWVIVKLACTDTDTLSISVVSYASIIIYVFHGFFIMWTYMHLIKTRARSKEDRAKFMQTCVPHLTSLITLLVVIVFDLMYMRFGFTDLPQSLQNLIAIEFLLIPPVMNPLIYGYKLTKIQSRILSLIYFKQK